ncbi:conserved hypothetical protein [Candidatus Desulfarcum epimagneticum]|uniref:Toxin-antitoxin system antitoxin subunit n=1 Tax=uncultured Desulfobacteraceae bacterium TaxID=218296 RepID=A0A484HMK8_9BACT|nr:conserved hypothetical protein [uncultured Desulfobacteraceae bacterium]
MIETDIYDVLNMHFSRADQAVLEIREFDFNSIRFDNFEVVKTFDTFIYRFSKIQDYMGEKLFPAFLDRLGEYKRSMPFRDILTTLERLEIISSSQEWMNYREIRNSITHEYPGSYEDIIDGIKLALNAFDDMGEIYRRIKFYDIKGR